MLTVPNLDQATYPAQAEPDRGDFDAIVAGIGATAVLAGCGVTAQGTPNMTVAVAAGTIASGGAVASVAGGNASIAANSSGSDRIDLVVAAADGTVAVRQGTPQQFPEYPATTAGDVLLASVYVPNGATSIAGSQIVDKRVLQAFPSAAPVALSAAAALGSALTVARSDHVHPTTGLGVLAGTQAWAGTNTFSPASAAGIASIVKGVASQSGDLQQWQDSSANVLLRVDPGGRLVSSAGRKLAGTSADTYGGGSITSVMEAVLPPAGNDALNALVFVRPSSTWGFGSGTAPAYGAGQVLALLRETSDVPGYVNRGAWSSTTTYHPGDWVQDGTADYFLLPTVASSLNQQPSTNPSVWALQPKTYTAMTDRGAYAAGTTYALNDSVTDTNGVRWVSIRAGNVGNALPSPGTVNQWWTYAAPGNLVSRLDPGGGLGVQNLHVAPGVHSPSGSSGGVGAIWVNPMADVSGIALFTPPRTALPGAPASQAIYLTDTRSNPSPNLFQVNWDGRVQVQLAAWATGTTAAITVLNGSGQAGWGVASSGINSMAYGAYTQWANTANTSALAAVYSGDTPPFGVRAFFNTGVATAVGVINKGVASQSAALLQNQNSAGTVLSSFNAGGTLVSDVAAGGVVLKDTQATPHYWRVTVSNTGVLTTADLGTTRPTT